LGETANPIQVGRSNATEEFVLLPFKTVCCFDGANTLPAYLDTDIEVDREIGSEVLKGPSLQIIQTLVG
jgi:hypothetical protein